MALTALIALAPADARAAKRVASPVKLIGATGSRAIELSSCLTNPSSNSVWDALITEHCIAPTRRGGSRRSAGQTQFVAVGKALVALRNVTTKPVVVSLRYVRSDGFSVELGRCSILEPSGSAAPGQACIDGPPLGMRVGADSIVAFALRFALLSGEAPRALNGALYIGARRQRLAVPLITDIDGMPAVEFQSSSLHLSADAWPIAPQARRSTKVTVTGPGVGAMLARQPPAPRKVFLHDASGNIAELTLGPFKAQAAETTKSKKEEGLKPVDPLSATAKLELVNGPASGTYEGNVALSELDPAAATLKVRLHVHRSLLVAIFWVLVGVLIATMIAPLILLRQRAEALQDNLEKAVDRYGKVVAAVRAPGVLKDGDIVLWDLNDLTSGNEEATGLVSAARTLALNISGERNDKDFEEDQKSVLDVTARLSRWLRVAPAALRLDLVAEQLPPDVEALPEGSQAARATWLLRKALRREPSTVEAADLLVTRVLAQTAWHQSYREALSAGAENAALKKQLEELDVKVGEGDFMQRTPDAQDQLDLELEFIRGQLGLPRTAELPAVNVGGLPVDWDATPMLFSGWSALDSASFSHLRAESTHRRVKWKLPSRWERAWSICFAAVSSAIYALVVYNSTWGTAKDILLALTAGFAGLVTVKTALPIFTSRRLR